MSPPKLKNIMNGEKHTLILPKVDSFINDGKIRPSELKKGPVVKSPSHAANEKLQRYSNASSGAETPVNQKKNFDFKTMASGGMLKASTLDKLEPALSPSHTVSKLQTLKDIPSKKKVLCEDEELEQNRDLAKFVEIQQKRIMKDSCKQAEKLADMQNRRMKHWVSKKPPLKHSTKCLAEVLSQPSVGQKFASYKPSVDTQHRALISNNSDNDIQVDSVHKSFDEVQNTLTASKNRQLASFVAPTTPKKKPGIASERTKRPVKKAKGISDHSQLMPSPSMPKDLGKLVKEKPATAAPGEKQTTTTKEYELNDMYKMMAFLGKDKALQSGKEELQEKLRRFRNDFKKSDEVTENADECLAHLEVKHNIGRSLLSQRYGNLRCGEAWP